MPLRCRVLSPWLRIPTVRPTGSQLSAGKRLLEKPRRRRKDGKPIASNLKSHAWGIPALFVLNPVSNCLGFTTVAEAGGCIPAPPFAMIWHVRASHKNTIFSVVITTIIAKHDIYCGQWKPVVKLHRYSDRNDNALSEGYVGGWKAFV